MKSYNKSLFIFRRDLRLSDNNGLNQALLNSTLVIPCFIFDPQQVGNQNSYRSMNSIQFMIDSLAEIDEQLKSLGSRLYLFYGKAPDVIKKLIVQEEIDAVFVNRDYTPFSLKRDEEIKKICIEHHREFITSHDLLLHEPEQVLTGSGTPYSIFTAFYKKSVTLPVAPAAKRAGKNFYGKKVAGSHGPEIFSEIIPHRNSALWVQGGSTNGERILKSLDNLEDYQKTRDYPELPTSFLSAHLKFGTVSIRQTYEAIAQKLGKGHPLLRQLYWRDFFTHVAYHSPFVFGHAFHEKYDKLPWKNDKKDFEAWCNGKTGFPIVDAGMRQLNATGWMHNRVRMIVGSFLTKDLHIDWRWGEQYFARQLVDYDPAVNNGNWQWSASTGCDAQPYFRIFNPWLQQIKFDKECHYIKKWVPELKHISPRVIHSWNNPKNNEIKNYPKPIVDHAQESARSKLMYKKV
jgi:deoxyribodipyrimidine photo-lyase